MTGHFICCKFTKIRILFENEIFSNCNKVILFLNVNFPGYSRENSDFQITHTLSQILGGRTQFRADKVFARRHLWRSQTWQNFQQLMSQCDRKFSYLIPSLSARLNLKRHNNCKSRREEFTPAPNFFISMK